MKHLLLAILVMFNFKVYADTRSCGTFLANTMIHTSSSDTVSFISYLSQLLDEKVIPLSYLQVLIDLGENAPIPSPFSKISVQSAESIHASVALMYIEHTTLDKKQIKEWAKNLLQRKEEAKRVKRETEKETHIAYTEMKFNKVKGGFFYTGKGRYDPSVTDTRNKLAVDMDYDFEMMSTQVTVKMWLDIMGELPEPVKAIALKDGVLLSSQFDMPITNITWWSALAFANKLSERNNLQLVYDFSGITFIGRPEDGSYQPVDPRAAYNTFTDRLKEKNILIDLREDGKLHQSPEKTKILVSGIGKELGYRLPTIYEQEFVQSNRGRSSGPYFTGVDEKNLSEADWYWKNAYGTIRPVAQLKALIIDDELFFDLFGNANEFSMNCEIMPLNENEDKTCFVDARITSGDYNSKADGLKLPANSSTSNAQQCHGVGFRLVRSLPK